MVHFSFFFPLHISLSFLLFFILHPPPPSPNWHLLGVFSVICTFAGPEVPVRIMVSDHTVKALALTQKHYNIEYYVRVCLIVP
jgi:hypothetical protein